MFSIKEAMKVKDVIKQLGEWLEASPDERQPSAISPSGLSLGP